VKEIAYSRFATAPPLAGDTGLKLPKAVRTVALLCHLLALAIGTKVSLTMYYGESGF
jgi:hypothetical protein